MKKTVSISKAGMQAEVNNISLGRLWLFLMWSFLICGSLTIVFYWTAMLFGETYLRFLAYLAGLLATVALLAWIAFWATIFARIAKGFPDDKVLAALRATLRGRGRDPNPLVRFEAAKGLGELNIEETALHQDHEELDTLLTSTLTGPARDAEALVRFEVARDLAEMELERHSYHHEHQDLEESLFRSGG